MKTSISSFDLRVLVAEWQGLIGGHVDKVYQREDEVIFRINLPDRGKVELYSKAGRWLCLHEVEEKPGSPPPFAQTLRRLLDNARLTAVEQQGFDRIALFRLERGPDRFDIIFEIFSRGNLVVGREGKIVAVLSPEKFKDRAVEIGEQYVFPVAGIDPLELDRGGLLASRHRQGDADQGPPRPAGRCLVYRPEQPRGRERSRPAARGHLPGRESDRCDSHRPGPVPRPGSQGLPDVQRSALEFPDDCGTGGGSHRGRCGEVRPSGRPAARDAAEPAGGGSAPRGAGRLPLWTLRGLR